LWNYIAWLTDWLTNPDNTENLLLILLIIGTVLTPIVIYAHQRSKIPKLRFDGFIKVDSPDRRLGSHDIKGITGFFVKVKNANRRSEGKAEECQGYITIGTRTYRTVWQYDWAGSPIGQEELILLFYMDNNNKEVNFVNYARSKVVELSKPYNECFNDNISIRLECSSGSCPKPLTKSIKHVIDNATNG